MQRIVTSTDLGENKRRLRVRIESDECESGSLFAEQIKQMLVRNFGDDPSLLCCGYTPFETLKMYHNGQVWIVEAEAIIESPNAKQPSIVPSSEERGSKV